MDNNTNDKKLFCFIVLFIVIFFIAIIFLGVKKHNEQFKLTNLFRRPARTNDILVDINADFSSFGCKFIIAPQVDINDLQITIDITDDKNKILTSLVKTLGNVKKGVQINYSLSIFELGLSTSLNATYASIYVTGGSVSYFSSYNLIQTYKTTECCFNYRLF